MFIVFKLLTIWLVKESDDEFPTLGGPQLHILYTAGYLFKITYKKVLNKYYYTRTEKFALYI